LLDAVRAAIKVYKRKDDWTAMMRRGMRKDFSWGAAAIEYMALYRLLAG
jgi:starch synthase